MALALMAVMVLAAQAAALLAIGTSDVQIAANHLQSTQALFLAEAGIEDAFNVFRTPGTLAAAPTAPTPLAGLAGPGPTLAALGSYDVVYQAAGPNTARVTATATLRHGARRVLRATITTQFTSATAVLGNGSFTLDGATSIRGRCGAVHANGALDLRSSVIDIQLGASASGTASGTYHVPGSGAPAAAIGDQPRIAAPTVSAARLLAAAEADPTASNTLYQLTRDGSVLRWNTASRTFELLEDQQTPASTRAILRGDNPGWEWNRAASDMPARWQIADNAAAIGTFYIEGDVLVSADPGSAPGTAWTATIIAVDVQPGAAATRGGNVVVSGNPRLVAHLPDVVIAADRDIAITSSPGGTYTGLLLAHEQIAITGAATITGALFAEDAETLSDTIAGRGSTIAGGTITYDCGGVAPIEGPLTIVAWSM